MAAFKIVENRSEVLPTIKAFEEEMAKHDHNNCKVCEEKAFMT
jgi:hypothetical protein